MGVYIMCSIHLCWNHTEHLQKDYTHHLSLLRIGVMSTGSAWNMRFGMMWMANKSGKTLR